MSAAKCPLFPYGPKVSVDPHPELLRSLSDSPVTRVRMADGQQAYVVVRYDDVRTVLSDTRFSRAAGATVGAPALIPSTQGLDAMFNMDPPDHTRLRRLVSRAFSARAVDQRRARVEAIVTDLVTAMMAEGEPADLVTGLARPLPVTVICDLLGIPVEERHVLYEWVAVMVSMDPVPVETLQRVTEQATEYLLDLIGHRRRRPGEDLLTALIEVHDDGDRLTQSELVDTALLLFGTGQETTSTHLPLSVLTLCQHRDQWDLLVDGPELVPAAVEELLRYVRLSDAELPRVALVDVELSTGTIPAGASVFTVTAAANRDPAVFTDPDRFDIRRPDPALHITFGHGIHFCLGSQLARMELRCALSALVTRMPKLRLAVPETDLRWNTRSLTGGLRTLPVLW